MKIKANEIKKFNLKIEIDNDDENLSPIPAGLALEIDENLNSSKTNILEYFDTMVKSIRDLLEEVIE